MKGMKLFDNYEEDGQLSLFSADYDDWDEDWEEAPESAPAKPKAKSEKVSAAGKTASVTIGAAVDTYEKAVAGLEITMAGPTIRVKY